MPNFEVCVRHGLIIYFMLGFCRLLPWNVNTEHRVMLGEEIQLECRKISSSKTFCVLY